MKRNIPYRVLTVAQISHRFSMAAFAKPMLPAVYWLVAWLGCCLILGSIFYSNIQHQKRLDKIFDDYYKEMSVINGR
jgi:hypothetical protein